MSRGSRIRNIAVLVVGLGLFGVAWAGSADKQSAKEPASAQPEWLTYGEALERAVAEDKHIIIDFYTNWCGWCKRMDRDTYGNPTVVEMLDDNFLIAKINAESPRKFAVGEKQLSGVDIARQYGVRQFPMTWFVKPSGEPLANIPGYIGPDRFMKVLEYVHERRYEKPAADERQAKEQQK